MDEKQTKKITNYPATKPIKLSDFQIHIQQDSIQLKPKVKLKFPVENVPDPMVVNKFKRRSLYDDLQLWKPICSTSVFKLYNVCEFCDIGLPDGQAYADHMKIHNGLSRVKPSIKIPTSDCFDTPFYRSN